jgi:hypothetical protein
MSKNSDRYMRKVKAQIELMMENLAAVETADLVKAIDAKLMFAIGSASDASNHRADAARMYVVLHDRKVAEGADWWQWHRDNFVRSKKDAQKLLAIGRAYDPEAALEQERTSTRERMAKHRAGGAHKADVRDTNIVQLAVKRIEKEIAKLDRQQRMELWSTLREKWHGEIIGTENSCDESAGSSHAIGH